MKKRVIYLLMTVVAMLSACNGTTGNNGNGSNDTFVTKSFHSECKLDSTEKESPKFVSNISVKVMESDNKEREKKVNASVANALYGFKGLSLDAATDSFISIAQDEYYDLLPEYFNEKKINPKAEWFNFMYQIDTDVEYGRKNVIIYKIECNYYTGGPHPNSFVTYINMDPETGDEITLNDVFREGYEDFLVNRLTDALADKLGANSRREIMEKGFLTFNDIYPSENFMLKKDSIHFFYNRYDIAPYAAGTTTLSFAYDDLSGIMK